MPPVGFEPTISVLERAKTVRALDRAATAIGTLHLYYRFQTKSAVQLIAILMFLFIYCFFTIYSRYLKRVISKRDGCVYLKQVSSSDGSLELI
jgi:hypothetical protein